MRYSRILRWSAIGLCCGIPVLAAATTSFLWFDNALLERVTDRPEQWLGVLTTVLLWSLVLASAALVLRLRSTARQLESLRLRRELEAATLEAPDEYLNPLAGFKSVSGWLAFLLGVVASVGIWAFDAESLIPAEQTTLWVGVAISAILWLLVLANALNRRAARRAMAFLQEARRSEARALHTIQSLSVMISASAPDGSRSRFNGAFQRFAGRSEDELKERGWLECVQRDEREQVLGMIVNHKPRPREHLKLEYIMHDLEGAKRWIREFLMPRFGPDGALLEYIACATDITAQVQNETEHDEAAGALRGEVGRLEEARSQLAKQRDELMARVAAAEQEAKAATSECATARSQLEKGQQRAKEQVDSARRESKQLKSDLKTITKEREQARAEAERSATSITRLEQEVANFRASETTLRSELEQARAELKDAGHALAERTAEVERASGAMGRQEQTVEELQATERALREQLAAVQPERDAAREELQSARAELERATQEAEALRQSNDELRAGERELRERIEHDEARHEKARHESEDARRTEAQFRVKINKLTARCEELEQQLEAAANERASAGNAPATGLDGAPLSDGGAAFGRELSAELQLGLGSVARINEQLSQCALDEMQRNFIENAQASIDAMRSLVDGVINGDGGAPLDSGESQSRAFDLRTAASGACDLVRPAAEERGVTIQHDVEQGVPPLVVTDPVRLRQVLMYLLNSALQVVEGGQVRLRIGAEGVLAAHATIRFELSHPSARVGADRIEELFSLNKVDPADPARRRAADAWRTISELQGNFAFNLPENGGFTVWFDLVLPRLAAVRPDDDDRAAAGLIGADSPAAAASAPAPTTPAAGLTPAPDDPASAAAPPVIPAPAAASTSAAPRMPQELLDSNLGPVLELGAESARILMTRVPQNQVTIELPGDDDTVSIEAEVLSSDRSGLRKHEVVLRFLDVSEPLRRQIMKIVLDHRAGATLMPMDNGPVE